MENEAFQSLLNELNDIDHPLEESNSTLLAKILEVFEDSEEENQDIFQNENNSQCIDFKAYNRRFFPAGNIVQYIYTSQLPDPELCNCNRSLAFRFSCRISLVNLHHHSGN